MGFPPWSRGPLLHRGGEVAALPFGRTRGFKPRVRYNLIRQELPVRLPVRTRSQASRQAGRPIDHRLVRSLKVSCGYMTETALGHDAMNIRDT